ncbi:unnamed protein product [Mytilus coruscus]|uniref:C-type lectin domain-containing protein n=1 Tax=Mytilus coruscus TaxID=42192 RepID=A0A6J8BET5_MYTCO|nr:unnamed protein product [Mytilus coruscus]
MTFFYNDKTGECVLHSKTFKYSQPELNSGNWNMYLFEVEGRPTLRVAIQGRSVSPWFVWTLFDGSPLSYTNWRLPGPKTGDYYIQIFKDDQWTEQVNFNVDKNAIFLCEIR